MEQVLTYRLGDSVLDLARGTLRRAGELVSLRPKTFKLLEYLAHNAGRVVSKDELLDAVWPRRTVGEDSLAQCVSDARKCVGDEEQTIIRTVPRRGYLFQQPAAMPNFPQPLPRAPVDLDLEPMGPKIVVFPFRLAVRNAAMKPIFEEVVEDITAALSYFRALDVLPLSAAAALARRPAQDRHAALIGAGVDYIVEGKVEGGNPLFNVVVTLAESRSGRCLLTQTFSFRAEGIAAFHQTVARQVTRALVFNIESAAWQRMPCGTTSVHVW